MKYWPEPDPGTGNIDGSQNYTRASTLVNSGKQYTLKMDHQFTTKFSIAGFGAFQTTDEPFATYYEGDLKIADGSAHVLKRTAKVLALNGTWARTNTEVMTFRYGYSRFDDYNVPYSQGFDVKSLGFSNNFLSQVTFKKFPSVSVSGMRGFGDSSYNPLYYYAQNANFGIARFVGRHSLKYGFDFRHVGAFYHPQGQGSGTFSFTEGFTRNDPAISDTRWGNGMASFLLGHPSSVSMTNASPLDGYFRYYAGYLQDDFRLNNRLTFNIGMRYEYEGGMREKENRITVGFDRTAKNPISDSVRTALGREVLGGLMYAGTAGFPTQQGNPPRTKFGPRVGVAWNAPNGFVVRGGYGIFYAPEQYTSPSSTVWATQGYTITDNAVTSTAGTTLYPAPGVLANPFPNGVRQVTGNSQGLGSLLGDAVNFVDQNMKAGRVQQYTIDIQREMPGGLVLSAGYVGSWTSNVTIGGTGSQSVNINQIPRSVPLNSSLRDQVPNPFFGLPGVAGSHGANQTIARGQLLRPFPQFTSVNMQRVHEGFARYNSLVVKGEKRSANGLTIRANWTWSKNLDNVLGEDNFFASESNSIQDAYNLKNEYAYSTIDTPHRVNITPVYQLPFGSGRPFMNGGGWTDKVFGGWTVSTIATFQTGFPLTISQSTETTTAFEGSQRPIRVLGVDPATSGRIQDRLGGTLSSSPYLNRGAYMESPALTFGNLARNVGDVRTPGARIFNASLSKTTSITEGVRLTFRLEANNATNTPRFSGPNTNLSGSTFGWITSQTGFARQIQWMARATF